MTAYPADSAAAQGWSVCQTCMRIDKEHNTSCPICGSRLQLRPDHGIQQPVALLLCAVVFYLPAMLWPIMHTTQLGRTTGNTITQGVLILWSSGSYPIAIVIFIASVVVPLGKMISLGWLCWRVYSPQPFSRRQVTRVYFVVEIIGKWSMVDVFVVALLAGLVQLDNLMRIEPGNATLPFTAVVIFTMLAAQTFDPRLIWDKEHAG
ncbi:MAG: paraquat-inducible protein A [Pseudomonadota bacterium]